MVNATSKTSRLIGCYQLHPHVIPLPSTTSIQLTEDDEFIIMANAAFWACISPDNAVAHIRDISDAKMAASKLRDLALAYGSKEEISIIVVHLLTSSRSASHRISPLSDGEDKDSPLLRSGSHKKRTTTSKLSRPKTFHGEADLHCSTASLGRAKQVTTTDIINPSIKHGTSKSVKELYSKPKPQVKQQPTKEITSFPNDNHVSSFQHNSPQVVVKKKSPEQANRKQKTSAAENDISGKASKQARQASKQASSSVGTENNPPAKQVPFVQSQVKTSHSNQTKPISHDPQLLSHDPQSLSCDPQPLSHDFQSLSHSSSYSNVTDQISTEAQSLNESANPTWFESLPPMQLDDSFGNDITDTFGLELGMISEMIPSSTDSNNVVLGKRDVDQGWGTRSRSYTQPASSMRNTDQEQAKANFNFDELLAGLDNTWMTTIPSLPEDNKTASNNATATKSTMSREDSLFLDNPTLMDQFDQISVDENELNDLINQLSDFVNDTS